VQFPLKLTSVPFSLSRSEVSTSVHGLTGPEDFLLVDNSFTAQARIGFEQQGDWTHQGNDTPGQC